jgi:hypothetical protein
LNSREGESTVWRNVGLWGLAVVITLASAVYQRVTGPTYPVSGTVEFRGAEISYELQRSHGGPGDQPVTLNVPDKEIGGALVWRRYKTDDVWTRQTLVRVDGNLSGTLPHQPPAGKLEYHIEVTGNGERRMIPDDENIITRFKGDVPAAVLAPHVMLMFLGMLVSTRAGLEAMAGGRRKGLYAILAAALIFAGGMIFGSIVQKHAFGAYWTGFPVGLDLTDNKTLISMVIWAGALVAVRKNAGPRRWIIAASAVTLVIFMIPHSLRGSELKYTLAPGRPGIEVQTQSLPVEELYCAPGYLAMDGRRQGYACRQHRDGPDIIVA